MTELAINNKSYHVTGSSARSLANVLRDELGLMGTKISCDEGECGSCTVLIDGKAVTACLILVDQAVGRKIQTIEGLTTKSELHPIQQAFIDEQGFQCGACTPGFIMSAKAFLDKNSAPTEQQTTDAMSGNICRCGAHPYIVKAVLNAAEKMQQEQVSTREVE